jgi:predicted kinase
MATAYLMVGFAGVGKTTYAKKLAGEKCAVRFTPDDWMEQLFTERLSIDEFSRHFGRVCDLVWGVASQLLSNGQDVILDVGFWSRESRDHARDRLAKIGAHCELIFVDCEESIIEERLLMRKGSFWSSDAIKEKLRAFERPQPDEICRIVRADA